MLELVTHPPGLKASPLFDWEPNTRRFRRTRTGRFISFEDIENLRNEYIEQEQAANEALVARLWRREITIQEWELEFRAKVRRVWTVQYLIGKGGRLQMTQRDWGILGRMLRDQYQFIQGFAQDIIDGRYTTEQEVIAAGRMRFYDLKSHEAYEVANLEKWRGTEQRLIWRYTPEKRHCSDCPRLHNQVHTYTEWRSSGWLPRSSKLNCFGIHCGCGLFPTNEPIRGKF